MFPTKVKWHEVHQSFYISNWYLFLLQSRIFLIFFMTSASIAIFFTNDFYIASEKTEIESTL